MKKLVSAILILVLVLSVSTIAFADDNGVMITKTPTDEYRPAGGTAVFIAGATRYDVLNWTFVRSDGEKFSVQEFQKLFPTAVVNGAFAPELTVGNLSTEMNDWRVYCSFFKDGVPKDTDIAYLYVNPVYVSAPVYSAPVYSTPVYSAPVTYTTPTYNIGDPDGTWRDEYGTFTPAHPDPVPTFYNIGDPNGTWRDEYGTFTPAHPSAY